MKIVLDTNCLIPIIIPGSNELKRYDFPKVDVRSLMEFLDIVRTL